MNKIIKTILLMILTFFLINISQTQAEEYNQPAVYEEGLNASYTGFADLTVGIVGIYLSEVGYDANNIDLNEINRRVFEGIYIHTHGESKRNTKFAFYDNGRLYVGCGNKPLISYGGIINICTPDTTKPTVYGRPVPEPHTPGSVYYSNQPIDITPTASDSGTGIKYSKYIWSYESGTCEINGDDFPVSNIITLNREGTYTLTLCASDNGNECSSPNKHVWEGIYNYDPAKTCDYSTLPGGSKSVAESRFFNVTPELGTTTDVFSYDGPVCGYVCKDGYTLNKHNTEDNSNDTCEKVDNFNCIGNPPVGAIDIIRKPTRINQPFVKGSTECGYNIKVDLKCDLSTKPSPTFMNFSGENDSTTGTKGYTYGTSICGYTCKSGHLDNKGTDKTDDDECKSGPPSCTNPGKPITFTESTMSYNSNDCTYSCKETNKNYNTHGTLTTSDDTCDGSTGNNCSANKPTDTSNMTLIYNATSSEQAWTKNSNSCGYVCDTKYILKENGIGVSDDVCESDIVRTLPGEIGIIDKDLLADTYTYKVKIPVGDNESPIDYFTYKKELLNGNMSAELTSEAGLKFSWNMEDVDKYSHNYRLEDGSRGYTFRLIKVCDKANNCKVVNKDYKHYVYANTNQITKTTNINNNGIADGDVNLTNIRLLGKHGNEVVPASGINRTIDFNFNTINTLNQDQYTSERNAVFVSEANKTDYANRIILSNSKTLNQLNNQTSSNGEYKFGFKIYAPTNDDNKFSIESLSFDVNGKLGNQQNLSLITSKTEFRFTPLYDVKMNINTDGLKSENTQSGTIDLKRDISSTVNLNLINSNNIILNKESTPDLNKKYSFDFKYSIIGNTLKTLFTFINRGDNYLSDFDDLYIESGVKYINDGKYIKYRSIAKGGDNIVIQRLKILGKSNIDQNKQRDALENQGNEDVHNLAGKIDKATLKRNIKRNAFKLTRGMTSGQDPLNGIKYIEGDFTINDNTYSDKTVIVKGGNVIIDSNVKIGGLIVLKNSNGNGGMLYIDPSVTKIEAAIYVDKSIVSYRDEVLSSNSNYELLINQLYIYGAVFSENTIGGSLKTPPVCPYYVTSCTQEEAQKYDLNFLRSGFKNKSDINLGDFPVIIKYNPSIQTNPPIGFSE